MAKLKPVGKLVVIILVAGVAYGGFRVWKGGHPGGADSKDKSGFSNVKIEGDLGLNKKLGRPLRVALNQWPGWLGGIYANKGLAPNKACIFWQKHNCLVEFAIMDDPVAMTTDF